MLFDSQDVEKLTAESIALKDSSSGEEML